MGPVLTHLLAWSGIPGECTISFQSQPGVQEAGLTAVLLLFTALLQPATLLLVNRQPHTHTPCLIFALGCFLIPVIFLISPPSLQGPACQPLPLLPVSPGRYKSLSGVKSRVKQE